MTVAEDKGMSGLERLVGFIWLERGALKEGNGKSNEEEGEQEDGEEISLLEGRRLGEGGEGHARRQEGSSGIAESLRFLFFSCAAREEENELVKTSICGSVHLSIRYIF
jgi:hypothetical protein